MTWIIAFLVLGALAILLVPIAGFYAAVAIVVVAFAAGIAWLLLVHSRHEAEGEHRRGEPDVPRGPARDLH